MWEGMATVLGEGGGMAAVTGTAHVCMPPPPHLPHLPPCQERARIESEALIVEAGVCPEHTPQVYLYDATMSVIAMQYLAPPLHNARQGIVEVSRPGV